MTLRDFFELCSANPSVIIFYLLAVPITALLAGFFDEKEGHKSPWKYLYSALVYLTCIPGLLALIFNLYIFLFERSSVLDYNLYFQILPIISMIITFLLIRKNVDLDQIPGFDKLGGLLVIVFTVLLILWILDRTQIFIITLMPFYIVIILLIVILVGVRLGWKKLFSS